VDPETLDRLLMDRALGGLPIDVERLLTAYLEANSPAADRAREFEQAAAAARDVLRERAPVSLPPFPALRIDQLERAQRRVVWVRNVGGLAAALLLGIGLGIALLGHRGEVPAGRATQAPIVAVVGTKLKPGGFWSAARLYEQVRHNRRSDSVRLVWDSAVERPRLGGEL
jgi:anti-sigma factor RsiW